MAANCKRRRYFLIVAVGTAFHNPRFSAIQPVLLRTTATAKASASLGMARSSFSASEVCQIVCGDDNDEEFIFPGSDDDLGMNDTDDDDLEGDSESDEPSEMCNTGTGNLSGGDEPGDQADSLPGPSGAALLTPLNRMQSPPLTMPVSPAPLQHRGRARLSRPVPPPTTQSRRGRAQPTRRAASPAPLQRRGRARQSRPVPPPPTKSRRGRAQPPTRAASQTRSSRSVGEENRDGWSSEHSEVTVQPFTRDVGPTFQLSAVPMEVFLEFFTPELIDHIVQESNRYAALCSSQAASTSRPAQSWETNSDEIRAYLGFHILMGLNHLPELYDYWSLDECYHYFPIASRISRKRFMEIQKFLHFTDNTTVALHGEQGYDRLARVRPVIDAVQRTFLANYSPHRDNAIDEVMIKFNPLASESAKKRS